MCVDARVFGAFETQSNVRRIGTGRELKIVFKLSTASVEDKVNTGIYIRVTDFCELRHTAMPFRRIISDEVVGFAGKNVFSSDRRVRTTARDNHGQHPGLALVLIFWRIKPQNCGIRGQEQTIVRSVRQKTDAPVCLPLVWFEDKRELT